MDLLALQTLPALAECIRASTISLKHPQLKVDSEWMVVWADDACPSEFQQGQQSLQR